jgi:hypothetical protein
MITKIDKNIPPDFEAILDDDEEIIWIDRPVFIPYILTNIWYNAFMLVFGGVFLFLLLTSDTFRTENHGNPEYLFWVNSFFFLVGGLGEL